MIRIKQQTETPMAEVPALDPEKSLVSPDLKADQLKQQALEFFYSGVLSGRMSFAELDARLANRTNGSRELLDRDRQVIVNPNGIRISQFRPETDYSSVIAGSPFNQLLRDVAANFEKRAGDKTQATKTLEAIEYFVEAIANRSMSFAVLDARLENRTNGNRELLNRDRVAIVDLYGNRISQFRTETDYRNRIIELGLGESLLTLAKVVSENSRGQAMGVGLAELIKSSNPATRERMRQMSVMGDGTGKSADDLLDIIDDIAERVRKEKFKIDVLSGFEKKETTQVLTAKIQSYQLSDEVDKALAADYLDLVAAQRRIETLSAAISGQASDSLSVDRVTQTLNPLLASRSETDRSAGLALLEQCYRLEMAQQGVKAAQLASLNLSPSQVQEYLDQFPMRTPLGSQDAGASYRENKEFLNAQLDVAARNARAKFANELRENLKPGRFAQAIEDVQAIEFGLSDDTAVRATLLTQLRARAGAESPSEFDKLFATEIAARISAEQNDKFNAPQLGNNSLASAFVARRFREVLNPLLQTLRDDPESAEKMNEFLGPDQPGQERRARKLPFEIRIAELEKQRPLTDNERLYFESVERLSVMNPALVAMMNAAPDEMLEYLANHFQTLQVRTAATLKDGDYVPLIQLGFGPNGVNALGEVTRLAPNLAEQMLIIDQGEVPGGPFSIPGGPAWELNSANQRGTEESLPERPGPDEKLTVRAYGSPKPWYPGERDEANPDARGGSINYLVDWLPAPDRISTQRYPNNEDLALVAQTEAALLASRALFKTKFIGIEKNLDTTKRGDKILTLETAQADDSKVVKRIYTDACFDVTGLGEPTYGFKVEGSRAEQIIKTPTPQGEFPKASHTLQAFKALANKRNPVQIIGETLVIYGRGNSADTLVEYVGNLFSESSPLVRDITKVYIIASEDLSQRPRYAKILDLKGRNGRGNLVEQIFDRVSDFDYANGKEGPLVFIGKDGQPLRNRRGNVIEADHGIAATGFKSSTKEAFARYAGNTDTSKAFAQLCLPTNQNVSVADFLVGDPNVLSLGTASLPGFDNEKLAQLPPGARAALIRNGAENAVALGFRGRDVQAAVRIWLQEREIELDELARPVRQPLAVFSDKSKVDQFTVPVDESVDELNVSLAVSDKTRLASAMLGYVLKRENTFFTDTQGKPISETLKFDLTLEKTAGQVSIRLTAPKGVNLSSEFTDLIARVIDNPLLKANLYSAMDSRRRNKFLEMQIRVAKGEVGLRDTFID